MTADDQQFLDLLASVPQDMAHYGGRVADYIEKHTNAIASDIRDAIDSASWIPDSIRPPRRSGGGSSSFFRPPPPPQGILEQTTAWISKHRTAIAICVAFTGTSIYLIHRRKKAHARKRRAKKLPNGAKKEIVILACSTFHDALTRSLALDLERRGYVVYVTVSSTEEDSLVQQEAKADLRPLWVDLTSTVPNPAVDIHPNLEPIRELLTKSSRTSSPGGRPKSNQGSAMSNMTLAGIVVFPGCSGYAEGPLALMPPSDIVDNINTRLVSPVLTIQQFLPLLANHSTDPKSPASIIIAYPSIPNSLSPPRQIPECLVTSSLSALASSLRREVKAAHANITVSELKLGNFDMGSVASSRTTPTQSAYQASSSTSSSSSALMPWHSSQRAALQRKTLGQRSLIRGSSAREFHNAVFDALAPPQTFKAFGRFEWTATRRPEVVFVGSGARIYDVVGRIVPNGLVAFMMGYKTRNTEQPDVEEGRVSPKPDFTQPRDISIERINPAAPTWGFGSIGSESGIWEKV
ncbi:hypothetical protein LTR10_024077 [Elasticomyces elasticus]|uniref:DUF1776-domain-containing protein n=1 Tax=Exophiala sideris TaxID=1016849 RepID=A0ABR0IXP5_9EURO|nr:hypothetical protein LTR10_024077 [Elasticomyces elasticus]KAK5022147.1 hypothetical protein LTS07_010397 [Exophiala sideris]KAK5025048.1 hypothetical protein LTR13_010608 [Exophiala sideris]KAK5051142.1 hypothetical protein LTR69_010354 [Exophiala sideris]KAK5176807.1 hypothetical protein LTR44_010628 [Eurotiomycetes sp. CCFEE 6388]